MMVWNESFTAEIRSNVAVVCDLHNLNQEQLFEWEEKTKAVWSCIFSVQRTRLSQ
jgi:hypothetical protein